MAKINPFKPNSPVNPGMFVGRVDEIDRLETHLVQTRAGNPSNFMVTGERGIGKSSLLNYFKWVAEGSVDFGGGNGERMKFLVLDTDLDNTTSQLGLIRKFELALRKTLDKSEPARRFLKNAWQFLERVEAAGVTFGRAVEQTDDALIFDEFVYSLADTAQRVCENEAEGLFSARYDGVLILIDEADSASRQLGLGTFCKLLSERLERRGCRRVMVGLAGLDNLRSVLTQSHSSAPRLFDEIRIGRLSDDEVQDS
jgi:AAA ATPase domain